MNTTLTTVLYTSKTLSDGTHPLMLRLTKNRRIKYISLHISLDAKFWDFDKSRPKRNCPDKERINTLIETKTKELQEQILDFKTSDKEYTLNTLLEKASRKVVRQTVSEYLNGYIDRLLAEKRVGNAKTFQELRTSLTKFCRSLDFYFIDIDAEWLKRYEQWLRVERHYSDNSIGIRFRSLRVLYNSAITDGLIKRQTTLRHVQSEPIQGSHGQTVANERGYKADYGLRGTHADQVPQTVPATGKGLVPVQLPVVRHQSDRHFAHPLCRHRGRTVGYQSSENR